MRPELQELKVHIYKDGRIEEREVIVLRNVLAHYGLGENEARLLLDLNTVLTNHYRHPSFDDLLVESLTDYVLDDEMALSGDKLDWLMKNVFKDSRIDATERRLLNAINDKASSTPQGFRDLMESLA